MNVFLYYSYISVNKFTEQNVQVMGSVGPYGASLCDGSEYNGSYIDTINLKEIYNWHKPRIQALIEAGVDVVLFETIPSVGEANLLLNILSEFPNQKACLSFSCKVIINYFSFNINSLFHIAYNLYLLAYISNY